MTDRCEWVPDGDPLSRTYHDVEWGVPSHDDRHLFEMLILEGAQAGLSWTTILRKREGYRRAFAGWDIESVAAFGAVDVRRLLEDPGIVRNRAKVGSAIENARRALEIREETGSLDAYLWSLVGGRPILGNRRTLEDIPSQTVKSVAMSQELKRRGFRFVGPTICYAFMQAVGMANDHVIGCFRFGELADRG